MCRSQIPKEINIELKLIAFVIVIDSTVTMVT